MVAVLAWGRAMGGEKEAACEQVAAGQRGLITCEQIVQAGATISMAKRRVDAGAWKHLERGVYCTRNQVLDWYTRAAAVALSAHGALSGSAAAHVWGVDLFEEKVPAKIELIAPVRHRLKGADVELVTASWLRPEHMTLRAGVPVLQPPWLLRELGDYVSRDLVEVAVDHFVRKNFASWEGLAELAKAPDALKRTGPAVLREVLELRAQRQRTDSVLETAMVQLLRNAGLPPPVLQYPIDVGDDITVHADLAYPDFNLLIEMVGFKAHRSEVRQYSRDCKRMNRVNLLRERYVVLHYTWDRLKKNPQEIIAELAPRVGVPVQECFRLLERPGGRPALYFPL